MLSTQEARQCSSLPITLMMVTLPPKPAVKPPLTVFSEFGPSMKYEACAGTEGAGAGGALSHHLSRRMNEYAPQEGEMEVGGRGVGRERGPGQRPCSSNAIPPPHPPTHPERVFCPVTCPIALSMTPLTWLPLTSGPMYTPTSTDSTWMPRIVFW